LRGAAKLILKNGKNCASILNIEILKHDFSPSAKDLLSDPFIREVVDDLISCEGHVCRFPGHETTDLAYIPKAQDGEDEDDIKCTCSQTHLELQLIAAIVLEKRM